MGNGAVAHVMRACGAMNFECLSSMPLGCGESLQGSGCCRSLTGRIEARNWRLQTAELGQRWRGDGHWKCGLLGQMSIPCQRNSSDCNSSSAFSPEIAPHTARSIPRRSLQPKSRFRCTSQLCSACHHELRTSESGMHHLALSNKSY